jgi:hypothetical protein
MAFNLVTILGEEQANHDGVRVFLCLADAAQLRIYHRSSGDRSIRRELLTERAVRIVKHLRSVPCIAACTACGTQFTAPLSTLSRVEDAQANLQQQFDRHKCENEGPRGA